MNANVEYLMTNWKDVEAFTPTQRTDTYPYIAPATSDMKGKSVFITGASKGIGRGTAMSFTKAGCSKIAIAARSDLSAVEDEIQKTARDCKLPVPQILSLQLDVTSEESVASAAEKVEAAFGSLDVLFNNAGAMEAMVPLTDSDPTDWWHTWEVNIKGMYLTIRALMPLLLKSETKTIINNSSSGAHVLLYSAYQPAKTAVTRLTELVAGNYSQYGVIAISVHPGRIKTEIGMQIPEMFHHMLIDTLELPSDTVVWLCKERREWLNGRYVSANWDMEELVAKKEDVTARDVLKFRLTV